MSSLWRGRGWWTIRCRNCPSAATGQTCAVTVEVDQARLVLEEKVSGPQAALARWMRLESRRPVELVIVPPTMATCTS